MYLRTPEMTVYGVKIGNIKLFENIRLIPDIKT